MHAIKLLAHLERHDDLFERRIARAFADPVDGALDLPDSVLNPRQGVRYGQTQIVVAVRAQDGLVDVLHLAAKVLISMPYSSGAQYPTVSGRLTVGGSGVDDGFGNLREEIEIRAAGVFRGELDVVAKSPSIANALNGACQCFFARLVQFVFEVDVTGGKKNVDAGFVGAFEGLGAAIDVFPDAACQARDYGRAFGRYAAYRLIVAFGRDGKPGFQNVDIEALRAAAPFGAFRRSSC